MLLRLASPAHAEGTTVASSIGAEGQAVPSFGGYGWFYLHLDKVGVLPRGARLVLDYNVSNLRLSIDRARFDRVELMAQVFGDAVLTGLHLDYYRDGTSERERGSWAYDVGATVSAKVDLNPHFVELLLTVRRWFFTPSPLTAQAFVLPPEATVGELRLVYTYWRLFGDRSTWEPQRMFWRVRGIAIGAEVSADVRSEVAPWGARDPSAFFPIDPRNDPSRVIAGAHQWLRAGVQVHDRVRLQVREEAHWLWGADDLVRLRIGGQNPYSVQLAGAPWAGYLASRLLAVEGSLHVRVKGEHELGVLVDAVLTDDVRRVGDVEPHVLAGIGAFADLRLKQDLQLDIRAGWSPTVQPGRVLGGFSLLFALAWQRKR